MPDQPAPGVYIDEDLPPRAIQGVSTTTVGFVGEAEKGPTTATLVTSWAEFVRTFGGFVDQPPLARPRCHLPYAVRGFFENGGRRAVIARVTGPTAGTDAGRGDGVGPPASLVDYEGDATPGSATGLAALSAIPDISIIAAPDDGLVEGLALSLVLTCERLRDRFRLPASHTPAAMPRRSGP